MMIASGLHSQGRDASTMWINRQDALRKLAQADSLSVYKRIVQSKQMDIDTLLLRISLQQQLVKNAEEKESNYRDIIQLMKDQRIILEEQKVILAKAVKKEKRKRRWLSFAGLAGMAGAFWLGTNL